MSDNTYQHDMKRLVEIFRSTREADCYLYVDKKEGMARVPPGLLERFGKAETAMTLILEPSRKLARADAATVLEHIREQGFYLQMPPLPDSEMFALRVNNHKLGK
ncbi:MAG TPA: YcgL domain-containing protein [Pseudomonadales bacterium]|nr:YcgL domain-containing protein [Pseudomonadales bacterium]